MKKNKLLYITILVIIIIGVVLYFAKGFNKELSYSNRQQIILRNNTKLDFSKIEEIAKEVLLHRKLKVQKVERFENSVLILAENITNEEKESIVNKINEALSLNINNDEVEIQSIASFRIKDVIKLYTIPLIITSIILFIYFVLVYKKIGILKITVKSLKLLVLAELTYFSLILILRIPFGRLAIAISLGIYAVCIIILSKIFMKEKQKLNENNKKENE